jgi:membrane protein YdbS with pleckstrin-like domain
MVDAIEQPLLGWLRVPPSPAPPEGAPGSLLLFRAGRNYWRWRLLCWAGAQVALLLLVLLPLLALLLVLFPLQALFTFFAQRLDYRLRWYIVTDRSLRIRAGLWSVSETTMTFANIQDLRITAGPLQGALGLADLEVSSAGGSVSKEPGASPTHLARFAGIDNAEALRDLLLARLKRYRDSGLGDRPEAAPLTAEAAARELLAETRALRAALYPKTSS